MNTALLAPSYHPGTSNYPTTAAQKTCAYKLGQEKQHARKKKINLVPFFLCSF